MTKKRAHPNKTPLHCLESCFFDKILADISDPFKTDFASYRYRLMVIESLSIYVILIPLKSVSAEAVASALYRHVFTKHGMCNTILLTDRGSAFRERPRRGHSRDLQGQTRFWYDSTTYNVGSGEVGEQISL